MKTARSFAGQVRRLAEAVARRMAFTRIEASYNRAFAEADSDPALAEHRRRAARSTLRKVAWK